MPARMYQAVSAQAAAIHKVFVSTLGVSSGSCAVTEETFTGSQHMPSRGDSRFRGHHSVDQEGPANLPKAWRETQHPCAALVQSRHPQTLADG
jgi:PE family